MKIIIVRRELPAEYYFFMQVTARTNGARLVVDRRVGNRRLQSEAVVINRRGPDRRAAPPLSRAKEGFVVQGDVSRTTPGRTSAPDAMRRNRAWRAAASRLQAVYRGWSLRQVSIAGISVLLLLSLVAGYQLLGQVRGVEDHAMLTYQSSLRADEVLGTVRTRALLGSIVLSEAINASPEMRAHLENDMAAMQAEVARALPAYLPLVDTPMEREEWARLQSELDRYWKLYEAALSLDAGSAAPKAELIRSTIVPARAAILGIADSLMELERGSRATYQAEAGRIARSARTWIVVLASIPLLVGLYFALIAPRHLERLQRKADRQTGHTRRDLERLSATLVTTQEEERRSLARMLDGAVGQSLSAIKMEISVALPPTLDPRARSALETARATADSTLQRVRVLSQLLSPSTLKDFGLPETLRTHLRSFSSSTGIRADLTHERMDDRLSPQVELCLYRIVQEALANVARHSGASSCTVSLIRRGGFVDLTIEDDGRGIEGPVVRPGLGLIGMRQRAEAMRGTVTLENRGKSGARLAVCVPASTPDAMALSHLDLFAEPIQTGDGEEIQAADTTPASEERPSDGPEAQAV